MWYTPLCGILTSAVVTHTVILRLLSAALVRGLLKSQQAICCLIFNDILFRRSESTGGPCGSYCGSSSADRALQHRPVDLQGVRKQVRRDPRLLGGREGCIQARAHGGEAKVYGQFRGGGGYDVLRSSVLCFFLPFRSGRQLQWSFFPAFWGTWLVDHGNSSTLLIR